MRDGFSRTESPSIAKFSPPTAFSLFSGAGGMDIGVSQAGFHVLASVEVDHNACQTLRNWIANKGAATRVIEADIRDIDPCALLGELGLKKGALGLLFAGPPCQSFSLIGQRRSLTTKEVYCYSR